MNIDYETHTQVVNEIMEISEARDNSFLFDRFIVEGDTFVFVLYEDKLECVNLELAKKFEGGIWDIDPEDILIWDIKKQYWYSDE